MAGRQFDPEDPLFQLRRMAESNGVRGDKLIIDVESQDTLNGLRKIMPGLLHQEFVSPEKVKTLHPDIDDEYAEQLATSLSLTLLLRRVAKANDGRSPSGYSDLQQVIAGTTVSSQMGLAAVAFGLGTSSKTILEAARKAGYQNPDQD